MVVILFVHGTGVRVSSFDDTFTALTSNLARIRPDFTAAPCYWGDECGSRLLAGGVSIPSGDGPRGPAGSGDSEEISSWALLELDPLYELRLVSVGEPPLSELPPHADIPGRNLAIAVMRDLSDKSVGIAAAESGLMDDIGDACDFVVNSEVFRAAAQFEGEFGGELHVIVARAVVAEAVRRADQRLVGTLALDGGHRDALVAALTAMLGGPDRGGVRELGVKLLLEAGLTRPIERRRKVITHAVAEFPGDVLLYLVRGEPLREFIIRAIDAIEPADDDLIVLAHSLGGIAALEALIEHPRPRVRHLVTVGSQASLLYELNALPSLEFGRPLPRHVPEWTNIFDTRDLLGYAAAGIFPGRVQDRTVDNNAPFPRAHTAYFRSRSFFDVLDEILP